MTLCPIKARKTGQRRFLAVMQQPLFVVERREKPGRCDIERPRGFTVTAVRWP
jgi:hypothetical protein